MAWLWLLSSTPISAQPWKVLFYGDTHFSGSAADSFVNSDSRFLPVGQGSEVWRSGDSTPGLDWNLKTGSDFAAFDLIVFQDPGASQYDSYLYYGAIQNRSMWAPQILGNVVVMTGDPEYHAAYSGAVSFIESAIVYAASSYSGPGLYVACGNISPHESPIVGDHQHVLAHLLDHFGTFNIFAHANGNTVARISSVPQFDSIPAQDLGGWGSASHGAFKNYPSTFRPLFMVTDVEAQYFTDVSHRPLGQNGAVHVICKGPMDRFWINPGEDCVLVGQSRQIQARLFNAANVGISGETVAFSVVAGPNQGASGTAVTVNGIATWTYAGSPTAGEDHVVASLPNRTPSPSVHAKVHWAQYRIVLSASPATAVEPQTSGGSGTSGRFIVTRQGPDLSQSLTLSSLDTILEGTATDWSDYYVNPGLPIQFAAYQSIAYLDVVPLFDMEHDPNETVVLRVKNHPTCLYAAASPGLATVTIQDTVTYANISMSVIANTLHESGSQSGTIRFTRQDNNGSQHSNIPVHLRFLGTATFGIDYVVDQWDAATQTITIPAYVTSLDVVIHAIPDSRVEPTESIGIQILPGSLYAVAPPSAGVLTILDNDTNSMPLSGWQLTELATLGGHANYGYGINTVPDGGGGWRGVAVGATHNVVWYTPPYPLSMSTGGFRWDNGSSTLLTPPSGYAWYPPVRSASYAINDSGVAVGMWFSSLGKQRACYWPNGLTQPVSLAPLTGTQNETDAAWDINGSGIIVGTANSSTIAGQASRAVAWIPQGGSYSTASEIGILYLTSQSSGFSPTFATRG